MKLNKNTRLLSIIVIIVLIIVIITTIFLLNNKKPHNIIEEENIDIQSLTNKFDKIFDNEENDYVITDLYLQDEKAGAYYMDIHIPKLNISGEVAENINKEIEQIFVRKLMKVGNDSTVYTIAKMDFATEINNNILSLAIRCVLKEGTNPQRTIIKTYNYNLDEDNLVKLTEIIDENEHERMQKQIKQKIEVEIKREESIIHQGYSVYRRNAESEIYLVENATEFYLNADNILYIIYCYGNSSYTTETDLIITKLK